MNSPERWNNKLIKISTVHKVEMDMVVKDVNTVVNAAKETVKCPLMVKFVLNFNE